MCDRPLLVEAQHLPGLGFCARSPSSDPVPLKNWIPVLTWAWRLNQSKSLPGQHISRQTVLRSIWPANHHRISWAVQVQFNPAI
jgi:hypothetical protein